MKKRVRYYLLLFFSIAILMSAVSASQAETFKLELKKFDDQSMMMRDAAKENSIYLPSSGQNVFLDRPGMPQNPDGQKFSGLIKKDRDSYENKYPFKGVVTLGKDQFIFAMDSSGLFSKGYDKLYFDRNHNFDLTDDSVLEAKAVPEGINFGEGSARREFPRQEVTLEIDGSKFEYAFFFSNYSNMQSENDPPNYAYAQINPAVFREGDIELNGKKHHLVLVDFSSNGRFDDAYEADGKMVSSNDRVYPKNGDKLYLDPNTTDKNSSYSLTDRKDSLPVAKLIYIDDRFFNLAITASGDQVTLTPSDIAVGMVKNPNKRYSAVFYGDKGVIKIDGEASKEVAMPEGDWKLLDYTIDATEGESSSTRRTNRTQLSAAGTKQSPVFQVKKGTTVDLPFGPPYKPLVEVQPMGLRNLSDSNKTVSLNLLLQGKGNEICRALSVNGQNPENPSFVIATKTNEIVERGSFEYG